ncbi:type I restriction-modification system endonuclease [Desulfocicer vacuolatum]|uniref:type I restriction-modification system endonuclease n=1 Tax=Desulfocicer vacuolatum TaxID=2298 RepID=UPI001BAFC004|nr:type I restriction-modification system endonuclease [Desulfocicer vacuolatum]
MGNQTVVKNNFAVVSPNFSFMAEYDETLYKCAIQAERFIFEDPNTTLYKLRQFGELLAQNIAARTGINITPEDNAFRTIQKLEDNGVLTPKATQILHSIRKTGNQAVHEMKGDPSEALHCLRMARELAIWFHKSFSTSPDANLGPFIPPPNPKEAETDLAKELDQLRKQLAKTEKSGIKAAEKRKIAEEKAKALYEDLSAAISLAQETEEQRDEDKKLYEEYISELIAQNVKQPVDLANTKKKADKADKEIALNEADTRKIIDQQLRDAGWEADTQNLTYKKGIRPQKGKNIAISEWPTSKGRADYVFFVGLTAIAIVEAKKKALDVSSAIEQSKRYSIEFQTGEGWETAGGPWEKYKIPFLFATNGRPFLRQLKTKSGIWFLDGRRSTNLGRSLESWYTPEGLKGLLTIDAKASEGKLATEPTDYLGLRDYQLDAIKAVEKAISEDKQAIMLAMATGTGKTRTCIGLTYRLVKAKRFRRILFLVDRTSLGEQAQDAFNDVKLENLQSFADIYDIKELGDVKPEDDTRLHVATIQGMVRRILFPADNTPPLPVDQYDCIVVDECHRGYSLDRDMTEGELVFRSEKDYISKYTRVLDHFDAVKVGLTATPALHTTEIFGEPVYTYSYRQAVIDGYLIDHAPPIGIKTNLNTKGITWEKDDEMQVYDKSTDQVNIVNAPDEITMEVDKFNTQVITESFNRVVCEELANHIDPGLEGKTLIFCATDNHADLVVDLLKKAFKDAYGEVDDNAVVKITAAAHKPLNLIRRYKNERLPSVAVTVDLLTTGIDVPEIVNIVFIRRVKSRILYEQMLGRATRLCEDIGKEHFKIYDAVKLYEALEPYSTMKPVVVNPSISFTQLISELTATVNEDHLNEIKDQIIAKLQRKKRNLKDEDKETFKGLTQMGIEDAITKIQSSSGTEAKKWFSDLPEIGEFLDNAKAMIKNAAYLISEHDDKVIEVEYGYGDHEKPQDYLESFEEYIKTNKNHIPALMTVLTKPRDLTRKDLKELKFLLDKEGYSVTNLRFAWKGATNEDIAASIIGFVRRMALGTPLIPYEERVQRAIKKILASRPWKEPQRKWLDRIGKQLLKETIVDKEALNKGQFRTQGGFNRLNKIFDGKMEEVLDEIGEELWQDAASA